MSEIRTNLLKSERGDASPSAPFGLRVSGVTTTGTLNVTANATISGNLGVAGTITYEDVKNIDSVGIITAREGVFIPDTKKLEIGNAAGSGDLNLWHDAGAHSYVRTTQTGQNLYLQTTDSQVLIGSPSAIGLYYDTGGAVTLRHNNNNKLATSATGISVTGTVAATSYTGDGSALTGINTAFGSGTSVNTTGIITAKALVSDFAPVNILINGAMQVNQRGSGTLTINSSTTQYPADRWASRGEGGSKSFTIAQVSVASNGIGIRNALKITSSQATTVVSNDIFNVNQKIEGYNIQRFNLGEAGCKSMVLSFWVKTSVAGSHSGAISNSAENRSYPFTFTCTANNWHNVKIPISPITSGSFNEESGVGLRVIFDLGSGNNFRGTASQWNSAHDVGSTGAARLMETSGANMYLTMVQLEEGTVATPYEKRPYEYELKRCQRYYYALPGAFPMFADRTTDAHNCGRTGMYWFKQTMRAAPSMSNMSMTVYTGSSETLQAYSVTPDFCWFNHTGSFSDGRAWAKINSFTADAEI
tara:strand:- start:33 stop:1625 length:1593 start_codon:yes stop_codon:yes gene_type:complete